MRDPNRIDPTLKAIGDFWHKHPDWRLGQLTYNVASMCSDNLDADDATIIYNMEDDKFLECMNSLDLRLGDTP